MAKEEAISEKSPTDDIGIAYDASRLIRGMCMFIDSSGSESQEQSREVAFTTAP